MYEKVIRKIARFLSLSQAQHQRLIDDQYAKKKRKHDNPEEEE